MGISKFLKRTAIAFATVAASVSGVAHAATCGILSSGTSSTTVNYDPFNPTGLGATSITLQLKRVNGSGGEKTDIVNFYLRAHDANANGTTVVANSVLVAGNYSGLGYDIFYDSNEAPPVVAPTSVDPSGTNKFLKIAFTGNNAASDFATVNFTVQLPANLDLTNSATLSFDAVFACSTTGGGGQSQQTGEITNAISFPIKVLSALQASYAGNDLSFGEIGNVATSQVTATPANYRTSPNNYIRVQSSGPYRVTLTSGNSYRMTYPGGNLGTANQRVNYSLKFLGLTRDETATSSITRTCSRAGVGNSVEDKLYLQATLREGGQGKFVAPNYRDLLTVTIEPLAVPDPIVDCNAYTVP